MGKKNIDRVFHQDILQAIIVPAGYSHEGIAFFTPDEFSQQLAYMNRPAGYAIQPHVHNPVHRNVVNTLEVLFVRSGRIRVDFFDTERKKFDERVLSAGDVILLASGGHGFTMLEPSQLIEVKQGPYAGDADKTRFDPAQ
jgi:mannose-6-phosphate isomerase-like protein (cupin superfamily)